MKDLNQLAIERDQIPIEKQAAAMRVPKKFSRTERGFSLIIFRDRYWQECSLQKSSLATEDCIWLGESGNRMHLTRKQAGRLADHLRRFADTGGL